MSMDIDHVWCRSVVNCVEELACMIIANSTLLKHTKLKGKSENVFNSIEIP